MAGLVYARGIRAGKEKGTGSELRGKMIDGDMMRCVWMICYEGLSG